mmetsp:Transcript_48688/g.121898  ORF Transcript_48688/g.121898 Transcript_48688/m.121898 type:complete len:89 (-) Transcript_48688:630-896(-)
MQFVNEAKTQREMRDMRERERERDARGRQSICCWQAFSVQEGQTASHLFDPDSCIWQIAGRSIAHYTQHTQPSFHHSQHGQRAGLVLF